MIVVKESARNSISRETVNRKAYKNTYKEMCFMKQMQIMIVSVSFLR